VRHSRADIAAARNILGFEPSVRMADGLSEYWAWAQTEFI
jgi:nucleoside-diphosphate-sugar epimerase